MQSVPMQVDYIFKGGSSMPGQTFFDSFKRQIRAGLLTEARFQEMKRRQWPAVENQNFTSFKKFLRDCFDNLKV